MTLLVMMFDRTYGFETVYRNSNRKTSQLPKCLQHKDIQSPFTKNGDDPQCSDAVWAVREPSVITLYSDSQYVIKTLTQGWKRVKNTDLWTRLGQAAKPHRISWQRVRGHNGNPGNVRADQLANRAAQLHRARQ